MIYDNALCFLDMPSLKNKNLCQKIGSNSINISCIEDKTLKARFYKCEIASLSFVLALFCKLSDEKLFCDLDEGYLSAECCLGEEEAYEVLEFLQIAKYLIIDENINFYKDSENIKYFLNFLSLKYQLKILNSNEKECNFQNAKLNSLKELDNYDGLVLFKVGLPDKNLHCSRQFLQIAKCKDQSEVEVLGENFSFKTTLCLDENLQGTIGLLNYENDGFEFTPIRIKEAK
ncbi:hypothetical protein LNU06_04640 [Campylobacter sp. VicNov18]|uniref:hypothetical protein n=1 Tax=Campylobacter bilis TaxID=2691918 RepID=UPI00130E8B45|nr:hypothetical protein [Campylobacter bilis]MPV63813.1 hypothetical protein [Campylobacter hepaticus]MBM0637314.1 hypothetical protein [Campylobacter bilis]MCC8278033.1 hypothetical protein [Campylobacter bilis]MCC8299537.1 hypothetical protein [Campylobacter bilis]MCC8300942.1 hypothetical protein [Campylobacter bilis]